MTVNVAIPSRKEIENGLKLAAGVAGAVLVIRLAANIADKIHEKRQTREIKRLKAQVEELQERVDQLEKENKEEKKAKK